MSSLLQAVTIVAAGKFLFAIQDVIIKEMSGGYPVHQILTIRGLVAKPPVGISCLARKRADSGGYYRSG
jgi:hypothetical protein